MKNVFCVKVPRSLQNLIGIGGHSACSRTRIEWMSQAPNHATDLCQAEQIREHRLGATVFIEAARVQAIAAATGLHVDHRDRKIIRAKKPGEGPERVEPPLRIAIRLPRCKACRNRRRRLQGLLIERSRWLATIAKAV